MLKKNFLTYLVVSLLLVFITVTIAFFLLKNESITLVDEEPLVTGEVSYLCSDGHTVKAIFMSQGPVPTIIPGEPPASNAFVSLSLDGAPSLLLPQAISADGSRFSNPDETLVFWSKGVGAMVLENGNEEQYKNCIEVKEDDGTLTQVYLDAENNFTLRYPDGYTIDKSYAYESVDPNRSLSGVKFTVPATLAAGTNLSYDTYISIENTDVPNCSPGDFLPTGQDVKVSTVEDGDISYLVASTTEAGAGNRYIEYVYVIDGSSPCLAVRYFIHYSVFENYPTGTIAEFDEQALLKEFDKIRNSLTI